MKVKKSQQLKISGLAELHAFQQSVADGKKIFDLVVQELADPQTLNEVVYQESLLQLIFYVLDHRKEVTSRVNQDKSAKQRTAAAAADKEKVIEWCNTNPESAWIPYKSSVEIAKAATDITAYTSVRGYISEWRNSNPKK